MYGHETPQKNLSIFEPEFFVHFQGGKKGGGIRNFFRHFYVEEFPLTFLYIGNLSDFHFWTVYTPSLYQVTYL